MNLILSQHPVTLVLSSVRLRHGAELVEHDSAHAVYRYLQSLARRPGVQEQVRALLSQPGQRQLSASDDVWHAVATRVATGQLFLLQMTAAAPGVTISDAAAAPADSSQRPALSAPAPLPPPAKRPAPLAAQSTQPEPTADLKQDAQAQSLEAAARDGTPFCEICAQPQIGAAA